MKEKKYFVIIGGLWFDKVNGNTYCNSKIIDCNTNQVYYAGYTYGYGSYYFYHGETFIKNNFKDCECVIINGGAFHIKHTNCKNNLF